MKIPHLPRLVAALGCAVLCLFTAAAHAADRVPLPSAEVTLEQVAGVALATAMTDATGTAHLKVATPGKYAVVVQPVAKSRSGNYNRARINTTGIAITGATKPASGTYNLTGNTPCRVEVNLARGTTLTIKLTPPPQPAANNDIPPARQ